VLLYQSNRLENLFQQLCAVLDEPIDDVLSPEIIVVHNQGMAQWVSRQLALQTGIAANLRFPLPGRYVWELFDRLSGEEPEVDLFAPAILQWRIYQGLPALLEQPAFAEPAAYLAGDHGGIRRFQLSAKIAAVFDQYQVYRPDMLLGWQQGREKHWQAILWQSLTTVGASPRGGLGERLGRLLRTPLLQKDRLPRRLHLFGLNSLAPVYLEIFAQVGRLLPLHLYSLSPCMHYWGDLLSARRQAVLRARGEVVGAESYHEEGHPLLVSLGRAGQDFFQQLQACQLQEWDLYEPRAGHHLLAVLQNDLLALEDRSASGALRYPLEPDDRSIQFHCCFSPLREIQVLHDRLLDLFAVHPDLTPADILVSAPDIDRYTEAISAVFGETPERRIPWSIADRSLAGEHPQVRCFLDLLALLESRFTAPEVLALCENQRLLTRFGLDAAWLPRLHALVETSGIRWGLDAAHRRELEVEVGGTHSWRFGLDRLLLGYLMGSEEQTFVGLQPYGDLEAGEGEPLGGLSQLLAVLAHWQQQIRIERPVGQWCTDLLRMVGDFFADDIEDRGLTLLKETIQRLQADGRLAGMEAPLSFAVIKAHLQESFSQSSGGQPFLSGRVTFCNMVPMRSVPFRVLCLLGLGDQDFPRSQRPPSFDLMAAAPRLGDRNRRNDDRYLFLEALLSAREVLYISWVGRSLRDESVTPPSVVVCELRDYLDQSCAPVGTGGGRISELLTTEHPMQPFSRRCYDGTPGIGSYSPAWLPASENDVRPSFLVDPLEEPDDRFRDVDLAQLIRFWRHPVRFFLEGRLGLNLHEGGGSQEESEPFELDQLQRYFLRQECVAAHLQDMPGAQHLALLEGCGRLPQAGFGRIPFAEIDAEAGGIAEQVRPLVSSPLEPLEIDRRIGPFRLHGWLRGLYSPARVTWRPGRLRAADLLEWWLGHLCLCLLRPSGHSLTSVHIWWERQQNIAEVQQAHLQSVADPEPFLAQLLALYWQGLSRPLPFFPETSLAWAKAKPGVEAERAKAVWKGGFQRQGEGGDPAYGYFFSAEELPLDAEFIDLTALYLPLFAHLEQTHAAP
jgi:exodeoxyribonuclease V gamma subunit